MENINLLDFLSSGIISKVVEKIPLYSTLGIYDSIIYLRDFLNDSVKRCKIKDKYRIHCIGDCNSGLLSDVKISDNNIHTSILSEYDLTNIFLGLDITYLKTFSGKHLRIENNEIFSTLLQNPYKIDIGSTSVIVINNLGKIYVTGFSIHYSLGDGDGTGHPINNTINIPVLDENNNEVLFNFVSTYQLGNVTLLSYFISVDGQVYVTGLIDTLHEINGPVLFPILDNNGNNEFIVKIMSNRKTSLYLTENGEIYYSGNINTEAYNLPNYLIYGRVGRTFDPVKIQILDDNGNVEIIKDFAINSKGIMYLTTNNDLYHIKYKKVIETIIRDTNRKGYQRVNNDEKTLINVVDDYGNIQNIVKIVMKEKFILYLTFKGDVYYSGEINIFKNKRQLSSETPVKFSIINDMGIVTDIDANNRKIMFIT